MSLLRKIELPTKSQLQAGSLSITFPTELALASFLVEAKWTFTNFSIAHHNLRSSRATPSRLGGFTSKSNKCHEDYFTKFKCSQRGSHSTQSWIYHKSLKPHKEVLGGGHKDLEMRCFMDGTNTLQRGKGEAFILAPPKTSQ
jgi:hypothetical protein